MVINIDTSKGVFLFNEFILRYIVVCMNLIKSEVTGASGKAGSRFTPSLCYWLCHI